MLSLKAPIVIVTQFSQSKEIFNPKMTEITPNVVILSNLNEMAVNRSDFRLRGGMFVDVLGKNQAKIKICLNSFDHDYTYKDIPNESQICPLCSRYQRFKALCVQFHQKSEALSKLEHMLNISPNLELSMEV